MSPLNLPGTSILRSTNIVDERAVMSTPNSAKPAGLPTYLRVFITGGMMFVGVVAFMAWLAFAGPGGPGWDFLEEPPLGWTEGEIRERLGEPGSVFELWQHELTAQHSLFLRLTPGPNVKNRRIRGAFVRAVDGTGFWESIESPGWQGVVASVHEGSRELIGKPAGDVRSLTASPGEQRTCWSYRLNGASYTQFLEILFDEQGVVVGTLSRTDS